MNPWIVSIIFFVNLNFIECDDHITSDKVLAKNVDKVRNVPGVHIHPGEFPFIGYFSIFDLQKLSPSCTGSLIHVRWVLTSTQCLQIIEKHLEDALFIYGKVDSNYTEKPKFDYNYPDKIFKHEKYKIVPYEYTVYDIGLALLKKPIKVSHLQRPIRLADDRLREYSYRYASFLNWANYSSPFPWKMNSTRTCIVGQRECSILMKNTNIDSKIHVCGSDYTETIRGCQHDAGGPVVIGHKVVGVVTMFNFEDCMTERWHPVIFTKVTPHVDWIKHVLHNENGDRLDDPHWAKDYWV